jgi:hypothetical protein
MTIERRQRRGHLSAEKCRKMLGLIETENMTLCQLVSFQSDCIQFTHKHLRIVSMRGMLKRNVVMSIMLLISNQIVSSESARVFHYKYQSESSFQMPKQSRSVFSAKESNDVVNLRSQPLSCNENNVDIVADNLPKVLDRQFPVKEYAVTDKLIESSVFSKRGLLPKRNERRGVAPEGLTSSSKSRNGDVLLRVLWPIVFMLYAVFCLYLFGSNKGRKWRKGYRHSCGRKRSSAKKSYEVMLPPNHEAKEVSRITRAKHRPWEGDDASLVSPIDDLPVAKGGLGRCSGLAIKTRRFCVPKRVDHSTGEEYQCTICMETLHDGDRVSSMPCHHVFHADCLKAWVQRRSLCPLCKSPEVTVPFSRS